MPRTRRSGEGVPAGSGVPEVTPSGSRQVPNVTDQAAGGGDGPAGNGNSGRPVAELRGVRVTSSVAMPAIEKLKGRENYSTWAFSMRMTLIREGSWPAVRRAPGDVVTEDLKERALATICLSVENCNFGLIMDVDDPKEVWEKLVASFQDKGLPRKFGLLRKLTSIRLEDCSSVEEYVNELMSTSHKLTAIGFKVDDDWLVALLFMGLPSYYEPMVMGLEASGAALTLDSVKAKILQDVKLEKGPVGAGYVGTFSARETRSSRSKDQQQARPERRCYICDEPGHFAAQCPERREKKKPVALFVADMENDVRAGGWYFDSGASCHMARPDQDLHGEKSVQLAVGTANGSMEAVSRGTAGLEGPDGHLDIHDVLKVPGLATNLLSMSRICKEGHTVIFTEKKCAVLDKDGNQVASGEEEGGLYRVVETGKDILCGATKHALTTVDSRADQREKRLEMALLVSAAEQSPREEIAAVDAQPSDVATDGPVGAGAVEGRGENDHAFPPESGQAKYQVVVPMFKRLLFIRQEEFANMELYMDEFMRAAHDLAERGFDIGDRILAILLLGGLPAYLDSFGEDVEKSELTLKAVTSRFLRDARLQRKVGGEAIPFGEEFDRDRS